MQLSMTTPPSSLSELILQNSIGFNGYWLDRITGLYILGNGYRLYNPVLRTFHSQDSWSPFGAGGVNRYQYCQLNPVNFVDPSGHISWQAGVGITVGIIGILLAGVSFGSSLALIGAGSVIAGSLGVASAILGFAAGATGIASSALEESDPDTASALGWASLSLGLGSLATGIGSVVTRGLAYSKNVRNIPSVLFRGDTRPPHVIGRAGGFRAAGSNPSVSTHLEGRNAVYSHLPVRGSRYISFSASQSTAENFVLQRVAEGRATSGWVYEINTSANRFLNPARVLNGRSTAALRARSLMQQEYLAVGDIPYQNIVRAYPFP